MFEMSHVTVDTRLQLGLKEGRVIATLPHLSSRRTYVKCHTYVNKPFRFYTNTKSLGQ